MFQGHRKGGLALATLLALCLGHATPANAAESIDVDQSQIDSLARSVSQDPTTFAGIIFGTDGSLVVRYAGTVGEIAARKRLAKHTSVKINGGKRAKVRFVEVEHSMRDLDAVRDQLKSDDALKKVVSRHFVDVQRNIVSVGVTKLTSEVVKAVDARFSGLVELHLAPLAKRASRTDDWEPWGGGIRINTNTNGCTAGYVVYHALSVIRPMQLVTAGHCGPQGTNWYNNGVWVGSMAHSELTEGGWDYARISGSTYMAVTYTGPATSTTWVSVKGTDTPAIGKKYCTNGATSGEVCGATVVALNACIRFDDGISTCHLGVLDADHGQTIVRPGDSGGAVISYSGGLKIGGLIIGGYGGQEAYFHSAYDLHGPSVTAIWQVATR